MALNLNERVFVLSTLQASGADVSLANGQLAIKGADTIPVRNIQGTAQLIGTTEGLGVSYTITSTTTIAAATTYSGVIQQVLSGETLNFPFTYTTGASAPSATVLYAAIAAIFQAGIDGGALAGTVTSSSGGVVFTSSVLAPSVALALNNLSSSAGTNELTASGSSCTNAAPRVLTAGAAHGLTVGRLYRFDISGVTGTGAANLNRVLYGIPTSTTDVTLLATTNSGTVTTTAATMVVLNDGNATFYPEAGRITGYSASNVYVGLAVSYESDAAVEAGVVIPEVVLADATNNSVAKVNAFLNAVIAALDGSSAAEMVAAL